MENGAFRKKKVYFSQVSNSALRDSALSLKAKGLYALIQSYITIEGFTLYKNTLRQSCKEGEAAFESAWGELKAQGYLKQYKIRVRDGTFCYEYELLDEKAPENAENSASDHTPKNQGVDNSLDGKVGVYKNTDLNNTDLKNTERKSYNPDADKPLAGDVSKDEVDKFVDHGYPEVFQEVYGFQHPSLTPVQRFRTKQIIRNYLRVNEDSDMIDIEAAAECFLNRTQATDGNIRAFATTDTLDRMIPQAMTDGYR